MNFFFRLVDGSVAALEAVDFEEAVNKMLMLFGKGNFEPLKS